MYKLARLFPFSSSLSKVLYASLILTLTLIYTSPLIYTMKLILLFSVVASASIASALPVLDTAHIIAKRQVDTASLRHATPRLRARQAGASPTPVQVLSQYIVSRRWVCQTEC